MGRISRRMVLVFSAIALTALAVGGAVALAQDSSDTPPSPATSPPSANASEDPSLAPSLSDDPTHDDSPSDDATHDDSPSDDPTRDESPSDEPSNGDPADEDGQREGSHDDDDAEAEEDD
jgi:hypothetical protein